jgi:hypothetical protein
LHQRAIGELFDREKKEQGPNNRTNSGEHVKERACENVPKIFSGDR